ncbi:Fungal Zn2-Cys6 binuclear cluster domain-containing protein [Cladophialophora immunda]|nr:Fungal Zn2-Cys6 binuclear cluster domain-containing protein [Cladophialophora immunda]
MPDTQLAVPVKRLELSASVQIEAQRQRFLVGDCHSITSELETYSAVDAVLTTRAHVLRATTRFLSPISNKALRDQGSLLFEDILIKESDLPSPCSHLVRSRAVRSTFSTTGTGLDAIPVAVAEMLLDVYLKKVLPLQPIFLEEDLRNIFHQTYSCVDFSGPQNSSSIFILLMVFAITTLTSKAPDTRRPAALAESLYTEALQFSECLSGTNIQSLQCILLLTQLGFLLPHTGNMVHLVSDAMRVTVSAGLHKEPRLSLLCDERYADFRRRLFWLVYAMERSVNTSVRRPFAIKDAHIDVSLPSTEVPLPELCLNPEDSPQTPTGRFLASVKYQRIQSEITMTQFCTQGFGAARYEDWVAGMEAKIWACRNEVCPGSPLAQSIEHDPSLWYTLFLLHRPCPVNPKPSLAAIRHCITTAGHLAAWYSSSMQPEQPKSIWHGVHNCFEAGIILLYNVISSPDVFEREESDDLADTLAVLEHLSDAFSFLGERWPAAKQCGDCLEDLRRRVFDIDLSFPGTSYKSHFDVGRTLWDLVFARKSPALAGGIFKSPSVMPSIHGSNPRLNLGLRQNLHACSATPEDVTATTARSGTSQHESAGWEVGRSRTFSQLQLGSRVHSQPVRPSEAEIRYVTDALNRLPSCVNCRQRRIKCDRQTPLCAYCLKMGKECMFFDPVLGQDVAGRRIHMLKHRFDQLMAEMDTDPGQKSPVSDGEPAASTSQKPSNPNSEPCVVIFHPGSSGGTTNTLFLGPLSAFAHLMSIINTIHLQDSDLTTIPLQNWSQTWLYEEPLIFIPGIPDRPTTDRLIEVYYQSVEQLFPILRRARVQSTLENIRLTETSATAVAQVEYIRFYLMLALATRVLSKTDSRLALKSTAFFQSAMADYSELRKVIQQPSICGLQISVMLCLYLVLDPLAGNAWRILGHASRTCLDLSWDFQEMVTPHQVDWVLYCTIFRLECDLSIAYGRPMQLPELSIESKIINSYPVDNGTEWTTYLLYKLALISHAVHDRMLSGQLLSSASTIFFHRCREGLDKWLASWELHLKTIADIPTYPGDGEDLVEELRVWGTLYHCEATLSLYRASSGTAVPSDQAEAAAAKLIDSFSALFINNQGTIPSSLFDNIQVTCKAFKFPIFWTTIQRLFSAALVLIEISSLEAAKGSKEHCFENEIERAVWLLDCLGLEKGNLCDGLAAELRQLRRRHTEKPTQ